MKERTLGGDGYLTVAGRGLGGARVWRSEAWLNDGTVTKAWLSDSTFGSTPQVLNTTLARKGGNSHLNKEEYNSVKALENIIDKYKSPGDSDDDDLESFIAAVHTPSEPFHIPGTATGRRRAMESIYKHASRNMSVLRKSASSGELANHFQDGRRHDNDAERLYGWADGRQQDLEDMFQIGGGENEYNYTKTLPNSRGSLADRTSNPESGYSTTDIDSVLSDQSHSRSVQDPDEGRLFRKNRLRKNSICSGTGSQRSGFSTGGRLYGNARSRAEGYKTGQEEFLLAEQFNGYDYAGSTLTGGSQADSTYRVQSPRMKTTGDTLKDPYLPTEEFSSIAGSLGKQAQWSDRASKRASITSETFENDLGILQPGMIDHSAVPYGYATKVPTEEDGLEAEDVERYRERYGDVDEDSTLKSDHPRVNDDDFSVYDGQSGGNGSGVGSGTSYQGSLAKKPRELTLHRGSMDSEDIPGAPTQNLFQVEADVHPTRRSASSLGSPGWVSGEEMTGSDLGRDPVPASYPEHPGFTYPSSERGSVILPQLQDKVLARNESRASDRYDEDDYLIQSDRGSQLSGNSGASGTPLSPTHSEGRTSQLSRYSVASGPAVSPAPSDGRSSRISAAASGTYGSRISAASRSVSHRTSMASEAASQLSSNSAASRSRDPMVFGSVIDRRSSAAFTDWSTIPSVKASSAPAQNDMSISKQFPGVVFRKKLSKARGEMSGIEEAERESSATLTPSRATSRATSRARSGATSQQHHQSDYNNDDENESVYSAISETAAEEETRSAYDDEDRESNAEEFRVPPPPPARISHAGDSQSVYSRYSNRNSSVRSSNHGSELEEISQTYSRESSERGSVASMSRLPGGYIPPPPPDFIPPPPPLASMTSSRAESLASGPYEEDIESETHSGNYDEEYNEDDRHSVISGSQTAGRQSQISGRESIASRASRATEYRTSSSRTTEYRASSSGSVASKSSRLTRQSNFDEAYEEEEEIEEESEQEVFAPPPPPPPPPPIFTAAGLSKGPSGPPKSPAPSVVEPPRPAGQSAFCAAIQNVQLRNRNNSNNNDNNNNDDDNDGNRTNVVVDDDDDDDDDDNDDNVVEDDDDEGEVDNRRTGYNGTTTSSIAFMPVPTRPVIPIKPSLPPGAIIGQTRAQQPAVPAGPLKVEDIPGYQEIPDGCPDWKRALIERKNKALEDQAKSRIEEEKKWQDVPAWKRDLIEKKKVEEPVLPKPHRPPLPTWMKRQAPGPRELEDGEDTRL